MYLQLQQHLFLAATSTTTAPKTSGGNLTFFILILMFIGVYFLYLRPRRAKLLAQQRANQATGQKAVEAGDTVVTTAGIIGRVLSIDGDRATVEIASDTVVQFDARALGQVVEVEGPTSGDRWAEMVDGGTGKDAAEQPESEADHPDQGEE